MQGVYEAQNPKRVREDSRTLQVAAEVESSNNSIVSIIPQYMDILRHPIALSP